MDDIGKCLGTDFDVRKTIGCLTNQGGAIERDSEDIKREAASIAEARRLIGEEQKRLSRRVADYNRHGKEMEHRRKEIEKAQDSRLSPSQTLDLNVKIDGFNRDLNIAHREIIAPDALVESQERKEKTFNTSVRMYDKKVSAFNIRADACREKAQQFNQVIAEYKVRSTGVHTIK